MLKARRAAPPRGGVIEERNPGTKISLIWLPFCIVQRQCVPRLIDRLEVVRKPQI